MGVRDWAHGKKGKKKESPRCFFGTPQALTVCLGAGTPTLGRVLLGCCCAGDCFATSEHLGGTMSALKGQQTERVASISHFLGLARLCLARLATSQAQRFGLRHGTPLLPMRACFRCSLPGLGYALLLPSAPLLAPIFVPLSPVAAWHEDPTVRCPDEPPSIGLSEPRLLSGYAARCLACPGEDDPFHLA